MKIKKIIKTNIYIEQQYNMLINITKLVIGKNANQREENSK